MFDWIKKRIGWLPGLFFILAILSYGLAYLRIANVPVSNTITINTMNAWKYFLIVAIIFFVLEKKKRGSK